MVARGTGARHTVVNLCQREFQFRKCVLRTIFKKFWANNCFHARATIEKSLLMIGSAEGPAMSRVDSNHGRNPGLHKSGPKEAHVTAAIPAPKARQHYSVAKARRLSGQANRTPN
jgi:hypothetical protein